MKVNELISTVKAKIKKNIITQNIIVKDETYESVIFHYKTKDKNFIIHEKR